MKAERKSRVGASNASARFDLAMAIVRRDHELTRALEDETNAWRATLRAKRDENLDADVR